MKDLNITVILTSVNFSPLFQFTQNIVCGFFTCCGVRRGYDILSVRVICVELVNNIFPLESGKVCCRITTADH